MAGGGGGSSTEMERLGTELQRESVCVRVMIRIESVYVRVMIRIGGPGPVGSRTLQGIVIGGMAERGSSVAGFWRPLMHALRPMFGRYWPKDDRKRHLEQARERRKRQQAIISAKNGSPVSGGGSVRVTDIHRRHSSAGSPSAAMGSSLFDAHGDFDHRRSADPIRFERASPEMTKA
ncbi:unnamed protein product [Cyprideis torosa]|uniref:Uncharacterized protein n=1 Tax=Cyprideis torosa TaxID=163714 RepID=A0A7R8WIZ5_9CRUS|nr:unnamed protein product [Cyprideis torosa]CAG0895376.1 unnamed protein product [Cyprideis torosa]